LKVSRQINDAAWEIRFTGKIDSVQVNPVFEKANYYSISLQASDKMKDLENRKFSRRFRVEGLSVFAAITGVVQPDSLQRGLTLDKKLAEGSHEILWPSMDWGTNRNSEPVTPPNYRMFEKNTGELPKLSDSPAEKEAAQMGAYLSYYTLTPTFAIVAKDDTQEISLSDVSEYDSAGTWSSSDTSIGTITDNRSGDATYKQIEAGTCIVTYTDSFGNSGTATMMSIPLHSHEDLSSGGPAAGVYKSE